MVRTINGMMIILVVLGVVGCRACRSPYDTCQPTFHPQKGGACGQEECYGELYRAGSIFGGEEQTQNEDADCKSCSGGDFNLPAWNVGEGGTGTSYSDHSATSSYSALPAIPAKQVALPGTNTFFSDNDFSLEGGTVESLPDAILKSKSSDR